MLFNSLIFLYAFLPLTYLVFWRLHTQRQRYVWLTITGYAFYSFWNYKYCALLLFSTVVSYLAGLGLLRWTDPVRRRWCLVASIASDLAALAFFKYADFGLSSAATVGRWLGIDVHVTPLNIVLPIGISFYTFHSISYIVDGYRGTITPTRNWWEYATYVSLFSQLVAGPIVRFRQIEDDLERIDKADRRTYLDRGWSFSPSGTPLLSTLATALTAAGVPALDLTDAFRERARRDLARGQYLYWLDDTHWDGAGVALAAELAGRAWFPDSGRLARAAASVPGVSVQQP